MNRERPSASYRWTDWVWEITDEVQEPMLSTDRLGGIYKIYHNFLKKNQKMSTCKWLDLETLESQPIVF